MTPYQRFFGAAPLGWGLTLLSLWVAFQLRRNLGEWPIHNHAEVATWIGLGCGLLSGLLALWTHLSLPPLSRGKRLVTTGAFRYFRHPIYTSFLFLYAGYAYWMNHWIFVFWAILTLPLWNYSVLGEEKMMRKDYPGVYEEYCSRTRRFVPGLW